MSRSTEYSHWVAAKQQIAESHDKTSPTANSNCDLVDFKVDNPMQSNLDLEIEAEMTQCYNNNMQDDVDNVDNYVEYEERFDVEHEESFDGEHEESFDGEHEESFDGEHEESFDGEHEERGDIDDVDN